MERSLVLHQSDFYRGQGLLVDGQQSRKGFMENTRARQERYGSFSGASPSEVSAINPEK